jgi:hypothetical protein
MRLRRYLVTIFGCVLACALPARAQSATTSDTPALTGGNGIRLGEALVLHLGLGLEFAWDSNVFYQPSGQTTNAFEMLLQPSFDLTNAPRQGTRAIQFDFHGGLNYVEYLTTDSELARHRQFNVNAGLQAAFFTTSPYNFTIFDNYVRSTQPPYTKTSDNFDRDTNELGLRVNLAPGGGRLYFTIGYLFGIDYFERAPLTDFNLQYHRFNLRASWKFFPKTAVYIAADETINHYVTTMPALGMKHPDSFPFHVDAGIQGLITTKLTVNAWVGYGNGFYVTGVSPNTAVGGLSLSWKPTLLSTGVIGYQHDFQNSLLGSYYDEDMAYLSWLQLVWRFSGFIRFQYTNERFKGVPMVQGTTDGTDNYITLNVRVDYPFKPWLFGSVGYDLYVNRSDRMLLATPTAGVVPVDYVRNVVYIRVTASY